MRARIHSTLKDFYLQPGASFEINSGIGLVTVTADFKGPTPTGEIGEYQIDSELPISEIHIPSGVAAPKIANRRVTNNGDGFSTISTLSYGYFLIGNIKQIISKSTINLSAGATGFTNTILGNTSLNEVKYQSWTVSEFYELDSVITSGFVDKSGSITPTLNPTKSMLTRSIKGEVTPGGNTNLIIAWTQTTLEVSRINYGAYDFVTYNSTYIPSWVEL